MKGFAWLVVRLVAVLMLTASVSRAGQVYTLAWDYPPDEPITEFILYVSDDGAPYVEAARTTNLQITLELANGRFVFYVTAIRDEMESLGSNLLSIRSKPAPSKGRK